MINNFATLKVRLKSMKENNWEIPQGSDAFSLVKEMMDNIGSTDPELRDGLILSMLWMIISRRNISDEQMKELLEICLSDRHLFHGIGKAEDDSVFNRTFTLLVMDGIILANNTENNGFLSEMEVKRVLNETLRYFTAEQDLRGYVEIKGWAHSAAHGADLLSSLAESAAVRSDGLTEILHAVREKILVDSYIYVDEEDERLVTVVAAILGRRLIDDEEIIKWIDGFHFIYRNEYPEDGRLHANIKNFLRSLYFRLKKANYPEFAASAEQMLEKFKVRAV